MLKFEGLDEVLGWRRVTVINRGFPYLYQKRSTKEGRRLECQNKRRKQKPTWRCNEVKRDLGERN